MADGSRTANDRLTELLQLAERARQTMLTGDYEPVGEALRAVADEIVPAIHGLLAGGRTDDAMALISGLHSYWIDAGRVQEGRQLAEAALATIAAAEAVDARLRARTMLAASELAFREGVQQAAHDWARATIAAAEADNDASTAALAEVNLARIAFRDEDAARIEAFARAALVRAGTDPMVQRAAYHMLAWAAHGAGDRQQALDWFEKSLAIRRGMRDRMGAAVELGNLAEMARQEGELSRAAGYLDQAFATGVELESAYLLTALIGYTGALAVDAGNFEDGASMVAAAEAAYAATSLIPDPDTRTTMNVALAEARRRLTSEEFEAAWRAGDELSMEAAVKRAQAVAVRMAG